MAQKKTSLDEKIRTRNERVDKISRKLQYARDRGVHKKLQRREEKLEEVQTLLITSEGKQAELREHLRKTQVTNADLRRRLDATREELQQAKVDAQQQEIEQQREIKTTRLKNDMGHFKQSAKLGIMTGWRVRSALPES